MFKKLLKNPFLWAFIFGVGALHLVREMALARRSLPEPLVLMDNWQLIDQRGQVFGKQQLLGKVVIADFFFTSCPTICPKLTNAMKEVYRRFEHKKDAVSFMSITVDPQTDTPEVLQRFMADNNLLVHNWHCLTGSKQQIYDVVVAKMRLHLGEKEPLTAEAYDIPHLAHLALFDQNGDLRGLFKTDNTELAALVRAANFLLEKKPQPKNL